MAGRNLKQWSVLFKGLGNINRLKILKMLADRKQISVSELASDLHISLKNTSRNLGILLNLDLVEYQGRSDRVYYSLSPGLQKDIASIFKMLF